MENILNRRMFQQPIYAKSGVYVPTIEDILQFYRGEFNAAGEPIDQAALSQAAELATIIGAPPNKDNSQEILDETMAEKYKALGAVVVPDGYGAYKFGDGYVPTQKEIDQSGIFGNKNIEIGHTDTQLSKGSIPTEGIQISEDLTVHDADNLPEDLEAEVAEKDRIEDEYAERQLAIANQKELFERLKGTKVKNLAGDMEEEATEDANVEMIKRNILQGTNIVEKGSEEYKNLSAANRMKVDNALSAQKKEELDLTESSQEGMENIIDAAGESVEGAIIIWNDMKNKGGEIAEAADEVLEGWKNAISSGWSDERKQELNDQIEVLKSKNKDGEKNLGIGAPVFGIDMETLKEGYEKIKTKRDDIKEWYTSDDNALKTGVDFMQELLLGKALEDSTLSKEDLDIMKEQQTEDRIKGSTIGSPPALAIERATQAIAPAADEPSDWSAVDFETERIAPQRMNLVIGQQLIL